MNNKLRLEVAGFFVATALLVVLLKSLLIDVTHTLAHDNFYWLYPIFHQYASALIHGELPLWNPYQHAGEPFYPLLAQFRLWDPVTLVSVGVLQLFSKDTVFLFNATRVLQSLFMAVGSYLVLRRYTTHRFVRLFLIPVLLFSSFFLGSFHQDGTIGQFLWAPWLLYFLIPLVLDGDFRWKNWIGFAVCLGVNWQSYQFVGAWVVVLFALVARPRILAALPYRKVAFCLGVIAIMAVPNIALLLDGKELIFPLRMFPKDFRERLLVEKGILPSEADPSFVPLGIRMPYEMIPYSGAMVKSWELLQALSPDANPNVHSMMNSKTWGTGSEAYIYLGILPWILSLLGWLRGQNPHKKFWVIFTAGFGLLMMGPPGGLHRVLYYVYPPLWFIRHTTLFVLFFELGMLYGLVLGLNTLCTSGFAWLTPNKKKMALLPFYVIFVSLLWILSTKFDYPVFKFPETNFVFLLMGAVALASFWCREILEPDGLWLGLVISQALAVVFLDPSHLRALVYLSLAIAPALLLRSRLPQYQLTILLAFTVLDLLYAFHRSAYLYQGQANPEQVLQVSMRAEPPVFSEFRLPYARTPLEMSGRQAPRYLSLLYQKPYALSPVLLFRGQRSDDFPWTLAHGLEAPRWNNYLMTKNYFSLIYSTAPTETLENVFGIRAPMIQLLKDRPAALDISNPTPVPTSCQSQVGKFGVNQLTAQVTCDQSSFLYWADGFDKYWRAFVDGNPVEISLANKNFKSIALSAGSHTVRFAYQPLPFLIGLALFYFVFVTGLVAKGFVRT